MRALLTQGEVIEFLTGAAPCRQGRVTLRVTLGLLGPDSLGAGLHTLGLGFAALGVSNLIC